MPGHCFMRSRDSGASGADVSRVSRGSTLCCYIYTIVETHKTSYTTVFLTHVSWKVYLPSLMLNEPKTEAGDLEPEARDSPPMRSRKF